MNCISLEEVFKNEDGTTTFTPDEIAAYQEQYGLIKDSAISLADKQANVELLNKLVIQHKKKVNRIAMEEVLKDMRFTKSYNKAIESGAKPIEAFYALIDASKTNFEGAKHSAMAIRNRILGENATLLLNYESKYNLSKFFKPEYEDLVASAHHDMHLNKMPMAELKAKYADTPEVIKVAEVYTKIMDNSLKELHAVGIDVSAKEGYLGRQTYSTEKVTASPESKARFKSLLYSNIDWSKTMPEAISNGIVDSKAAYAYLDGIVSSMDNSQGRSSILRFKKQRKIQFKEAKAWLAVSREFGYEDTLKGNIMGTVSDVAKRVGLYEKLGLDPKAKLQSLMVKYLPSNDHNKITTLLDAYGGTGAMPEGLIYRGLTNGTKFMSVALLQKSTFTALLTDTVSASHVLYQTGAMDNMLSAYMTHIKSYLGTVGRKAKQIEMASEYMHAMENGQQAAARYTYLEAPRGKLGDMYDLSFSLNGLTGHTNATKLAAVMNVSDKILWKIKNGKAADVAEYMSAFNLDKVDIQALNRIKGDKLSGKGIESIGTEGLEIPAHLTPERFKAQLKGKVSLMANDIANMAAPTPSLRQRIATGYATDVNSFQGQFLRIGTQFFATSLKGFDDMLYLNSLKGRATLGKTSIIAQRIGATLVTGYLVSQLRNMIYDKDVVAPKDIGPEEIGLYLQQSNVLPVVGDALFGMIAYAQASPSDVMVGPLAQVAGTGLQKLTSKARKYVRGEHVEFTESDAHFLQSLTPAINLPIVQGPMTLLRHMLED